MPNLESRFPTGARRRKRAAAALALALLAGGCASAPGGVLSAREQLRQEFRHRGLDPARVIVPFELSDEMKAWAREAVPPNLPPEDRLGRLRQRLLDDDELSLVYAWGHTGTAVEVFEERRANCLSFTNLFVGMAREVGVAVDFLAVEDVRTYRKEGDLVVVSDHVAVGYVIPPETKIYDFSEEGIEEHHKIRRVSDLTAVSMYYSNRGAEELQAGQIDNALEWLRTAVQLDPLLPHTWVNYGVGLRRAGDAQGAEECYRKALEIDPRTPSAYQNLVSLLRMQNRFEEAREFEEALQDSPNRNPFSYLILGDINRRNGHLEEARRLYRRARGLGCKEAECYAAFGQLELASGDPRAARKLLRKAQKVDADDPRTRELEARLQALREPGS
jgi:Flp pilus assembly protein TadD